MRDLGSPACVPMATHEPSQHTYRVGFVGAGGIAPEHADALALLRGVKVVSVCDLQQQRARNLARQYDIPQTYSSLSNMISNEQLDVVHVLTQPQHHVAAALECMRAGVNVYIEKPMGLSTIDCRLLVDEATASSRTVGVNHQLACSPLIDEIVQAVRTRKFGRINHVSVTYNVGAQNLPVKEVNHYMFSTPQSLLFEYCPHPFSIIRRLLGKPLEVTALASAPARLHNGKTYFGSWTIAAVAERGSAQLFFSAGRGNPEITAWIYGQDATAFVDLKRCTVIFHENSPFPITANLRDGMRNASSIFCQATGRTLVEHLVKLKLKPARLANNFYPPMAAFYGALRTGQPVGENASAGNDVIAYCEMAATKMKIVGQEGN